MEPTTLKGCQGQAKDAATRAVAWAEAADRFAHNAPVAKRFAKEAARAARPALEAASIAATIATNAQHRPREEAHNAQAQAARVQEWADTATHAATHAQRSADVARPFTPATGDLADLEHARQAAYYAWVTCPDAEGSARLAVLRAQVEEAEAAVQAALLLPALA